MYKNEIIDKKSHKEVLDILTKKKTNWVYQFVSDIIEPHDYNMGINPPMIDALSAGDDKGLNRWGDRNGAFCLVAFLQQTVPLSFLMVMI